MSKFVAPRQNAGGFPQRILHRALASETQQPRGKRHAQAAAGEQTLPIFGPKMAAQCATLCGRDTNERWARAEDGLQLPLADLERPYECGAGSKCRCFSRDVKARLQLPAVALAAAHGDAQLLHVQTAAGLLLMASEAGARADARIAGVK